MPILRGEQASAAASQAIVLDLGDLEREAQRIIDRANARAQAIIEEAQTQAQARRDAADEGGYEAGHARGLEEGRQEGHEAGRRQAYDEAREQLDRIQQAWTQAAAAWDGQIQALREDAEQNLLRLALRLAQRIIHRAPRVDPTVVLKQVEAAISMLLTPQRITLRIHPSDRPMLENAMPALCPALAAAGQVDLVEDESVAPGGCELVAGSGLIDATIDTQLQRAAEALFPGRVAPETASSLTPDVDGPASPDANDQPDAPDPEPDHGLPDEAGGGV